MTFPTLIQPGTRLSALFISRPPLFVGAAAALVAGGAAWPATGSTDYTLCWISGILASFVFAGIVIRYFMLSERKDDYLREPAKWWFASASGAVICAVFILLAGRYQIGGFDHSVLIDIAWRTVQGQQPYRDFPCTLPVGFLFGAGYSMKLFGTKWLAIIIFQALFSAVTFLWQAFVLKRLTTPFHAIGIAFTCQILANFVTSYWWYNTATTTCGVLFFLSALWLFYRPKSLGAVISYTVSLALLASMKPNIAAVLMGGVTLTLFWFRPTRFRSVLCSVVAFAMFLGWLALHGVTLAQVLESYFSISQRGFSLRQFLQDLSGSERTGMVLLWMALLLPWLILLNPSKLLGRIQQPGLWLAATAMAAGSFGFITNGESKLVDMPLMLLGTWWLLSEVRPQGYNQRVRASGWFAGLMAFLAVIGLTNGVLRHRVKTIGEGAFFEYDLSSESLRSPFFRGVHAGEHLIAVEKEVESLVRSATRKSYYFGPRMQWAYISFELPSPIHEPVWWDPGVAFSKEQESFWLDHWMKNNHEVLVFLKDDFTYMSDAFKEIIKLEYKPVNGYNTISVFTLNSIQLNSTQ